MSQQLNQDDAEELDQTLSELHLKLRIPQISEKIWRWVLRPDERKQLGDDYDLRKLPQAFANFRGYSPKRAVIDLAFKVSLLDVGGHELLRNRIGEPVEAVDDRPRPKWDRERGQLSYQGKVIRKVLGRAKNLLKILDAFEEEGWPPRISNPLPGGANSKKLRDAVHRLNKRLAAIKFRSDNTSEGLLWAEL